MPNTLPARPGHVKTRGSGRKDTTMASDVDTPLPSPALAPTVGEVMRRATTTVEPGAHLAGAAYLMKHSGDSALVVTTTDPDPRPLAVLTDTDISQAVADGRDLEQTRISDLPPRDPVVVDPGTDVVSATRTMLLHHIHHLPVVDGGRLVGIVDMADLCRPLVGS
jgi:CBS domain-containing protein